jgi:hypothetical protein
MRPPAQVAQVVGEVRVVGAKPPPTGLDGLIQIVKLGAEVGRARHRSGPVDIG